MYGRELIEEVENHGNPGEIDAQGAPEPNDCPQARNGRRIEQQFVFVLLGGSDQSEFHKPKNQLGMDIRVGSKIIKCELPALVAAKNNRVLLHVHIPTVLSSNCEDRKEMRRQAAQTVLFPWRSNAAGSQFSASRIDLPGRRFACLSRVLASEVSYLLAYRAEFSFPLLRPA
jgi:hypothetical protein